METKYPDKPKAKDRLQSLHTVLLIQLMLILIVILIEMNCILLFTGKLLRCDSAKFLLANELYEKLTVDYYLLCTYNTSPLSHKDAVVSSGKKT